MKIYLSLFLLPLLLAGCSTSPLPRDALVTPGDLHAQALFEVLDQVYPKTQARQQGVLDRFMEVADAAKAVLGRASTPNGNPLIIHECATAQGYRPFGVPAVGGTVHATQLGRLAEGGTVRPVPQYTERHDSVPVGPNRHYQIRLQSRLDCLAHEIAAHEFSIDQLLAVGRRVDQQTVEVNGLYRRYKEGLREGFKRVAEGDPKLTERVTELKSRMQLSSESIGRCFVPTFDVRGQSNIRTEVFNDRSISCDGLSVLQRVTRDNHLSVIVKGFHLFHPNEHRGVPVRFKDASL